jgi:hypothetical protein
MRTHRLGVFKLKNTVSRNTVQLDLSLILKNIPRAKYIWITKMPKENNKFVIDVQYDEIPKKEDKIRLEENNM